MSTRGRHVQLATRGSELARRQATTVKERLEDRRFEVSLVEVETEGDRIRDELIHRLGKKGAFVRSLDQRVLSGDLDAAVHSMKDMPTESPPELLVAGVPERARPGDLLLTPGGADLSELPGGATVGTSSLRRKAQLLATRSDLDVEPLRGNVDTRVEKLLAPHRQREHQRRLEAEESEGEGGDDGNESDSDDGEDAQTFERTAQEYFEELSPIEQRALGREIDIEYDAIVLAAAGLDRMGLDGQVASQELPPADFVPSPGQGALAVTAQEGELAQAVNDAIDHPRTRTETTVERIVLEELGGGCIAPIGVHAVIQGEYVHATVRVQDTTGTEEVSANRDLPVADHPAAASDLAADLRERGAAGLIDAARETQEDPAAAGPGEGDTVR
ncbi:hydroxymethylbilane synthase [Halobacteriales archaeon QS_3_64_16]|nr:MAG: hydroxymethylbilane synthase [Halobacteriales archaeon QS_3_64_16]